MTLGVMGWHPFILHFTLYLILVLGIGFAAYFATRNFDDYILGGRSLGSFRPRCRQVRQICQGWLLMGLPGAIYVSGLSESWIAIGLVIGAYFNWLWWRVDCGCILSLITMRWLCLNTFTTALVPTINWLKLLQRRLFCFLYHLLRLRHCRRCATIWKLVWNWLCHGYVARGICHHYLYLYWGFLAVSWTDTIQNKFDDFCAGIRAHHGLFKLRRYGWNSCGGQYGGTGK